LQTVYKDIQAENAEMLGISSDAQAANKQTVNQLKLTFPLLSDVNKEAINAYNATDPFNRNIARPQYVIIDEKGIIVWKFLDVRLNGRLDPAKIVEALRNL
jgi:peroxiredoxin Q/BCP